MVILPINKIMKIKLLVLFLILIANQSFGQDAVDKVYLDKNWNVSTKEDAKFYRITRVIDSVYHVKDYFLSGNIQMTGTYTSLKPKIRVGEFIWYYENGNLSEKKMYQNNLKVGQGFEYGKNGNLSSSSFYKNDTIDGVTLWYKRSGSLDFTSMYSMGKYDYSDSSSLYCDLYAVSIMDTSQVMYSKKYIIDNISPGEITYFLTANIKHLFYRDNSNYRNYEFIFFRNRKLKYKEVSDYTTKYISYYYKNGNIKSLQIISNDKKNVLLKTYYKNGKIKSETTLKNE